MFAMTDEMLTGIHELVERNPLRDPSQRNNLLGGEIKIAYL